MKGIAISSWLLATVLILASSSLANSKLSLIAGLLECNSSCGCYCDAKVIYKQLIMFIYRFDP